MLTLSRNSIFSNTHRFGVAFMNMEPPFSPPPPASSSGSTPASPLSGPLLGEPRLGQCRWKGPPLRATALTACEGPAWVSQAQLGALIRRTALPQSAETVV